MGVVSAGRKTKRGACQNTAEESEVLVATRTGIYQWYFSLTVRVWLSGGVF